MILNFYTPHKSLWNSNKFNNTLGKWALNKHFIFHTSYQFTGKFELKVWNCNFVFKTRHHTVHNNAHLFRSKYFSRFWCKIRLQCTEAGNNRSLPPEDDGIDRNDDKLDSMDLMEATKILLGWGTNSPRASLNRFL